MCLIHWLKNEYNKHVTAWSDTNLIINKKWEWNYKIRIDTWASSNMVNSPGLPRLKGPTCSPSIKAASPLTCESENKFSSQMYNYKCCISSSLEVSHIILRFELFRFKKLTFKINSSGKQHSYNSFFELQAKTLILPLMFQSSFFSLLDVFSVTFWKIHSIWKILGVHSRKSSDKKIRLHVADECFRKHVDISLNCSFHHQLSRPWLRLDINSIKPQIFVHWWALDGFPKFRRWLAK